IPRKSKRLAQIGRLADSRIQQRPQQRPPQRPQQLPQQVHQVTMAELVGEWTVSSTVIATVADDTSSASDGSEFEGEDLFTMDIIYAKKMDARGSAYYLVSWVGFERLTWQPAADLPQDTLMRFEAQELGTAWPVDYRAEIPVGADAGMGGGGRRARRS
ncbi:hypothetical protein F442_06952, partial [Phytophthora nicotianae P10297]